MFLSAEHIRGRSVGSSSTPVVFGIAGVTTSGLISMMPETRGRCLPETIGDAVVFGKWERKMVFIYIYFFNNIQTRQSITKCRGRNKVCSKTREYNYEV